MHNSPPPQAQAKPSRRLLRHSPSKHGSFRRGFPFRNIQNSHSHLAPQPELVTANRAGDDALIRGTGWNRNPIAAAMAAPKGSVVYLKRLGHGGVSASDWKYGQHYTPRHPALQHASTDF